MKEAWPPGASDEERSLRRFKDALMKRSMAVVPALLSPESEEELRCRTAEVEHAYARVREHAPAEFKGGAAPVHAEVLVALRRKEGEREKALPSRRVLVHMLANLDYYFFELASGHEHVHDMPYLTDEERAAEHGLRHDLFLKLYDELELAFDVSLNWPPNGYEVDEDGELVKVEAEFEGMAAIGYDYGYDAAIFHEGHADRTRALPGALHLPGGTGGRHVPLRLRHDPRLLEQDRAPDGRGPEEKRSRLPQAEKALPPRVRRRGGRLPLRNGRLRGLRLLRWSR